MQLLSIDPGLNQIGIGIWHDGYLWYGGLVASRTAGTVYERSVALADTLVGVLYEGGYEIGEIAIEQQIFRHNSFGKSIRDLSQAADVIATHLQIKFAIPARKVVWYLPETWKGQMGKHSTEVHVLRRLTAPERERILCPEMIRPFRYRGEKDKKLVSDVIDGIGIGLKHLHRF